MHGNNLLYCILLFRYEVLKCGDVEKLIKRRPSPDETPPSPPLLTPIQPGPDETLIDVPELTPQASLLDTRQNMIHNQRVGARMSQCAQAERMIKHRRLQLPSVDKGDTVALSIPQVDRGRGDPRNILGLVMDHDLDTDLY